MIKIENCFGLDVNVRSDLAFIFFWKSLRFDLVFAFFKEIPVKSRD